MSVGDVEPKRQFRIQPQDAAFRIRLDRHLARERGACCDALLGTPAALREVVVVTILDAVDGRIERKSLTLSRAKWEELREAGRGLSMEAYLITKAAAELFGVDLESGTMSREPLPPGT